MPFEKKIASALKRFHFNSGIGWETLSDPIRKKMELAGKTMKLKKKQVLFKQGINPTGVYILRKGRVKIFWQGENNAAQILFIYGVGEVFGFRPILSGEPSPLTAAALEDCEMLYFSKKDFLDILEAFPELSKQLLVSLSREYSILVNQMTVFAQRTVRQRLAFSLLMLNEKFHNPNDSGYGAEIKMMRTDLANYIGTSLENLVRTLYGFEKQKLIKIKNKSIWIEDFEALLELADIEKDF